MTKRSPLSTSNISAQELVQQLPAKDAMPSMQSLNLEAKPDQEEKKQDGDASNSKQIKPEDYAQPFCDFLTQNPTVFHAVSAFHARLEKAGFKHLSERIHPWDLRRGGKYFVTRNGSSLIAFTVGTEYKPGNGLSMVAGHIDALTAKLKPFSKVDGSSGSSAGFERLGVAPYAGGLNNTWWDRDLAVGGRVMVKEGNGKVRQRLVNLNQPIARISTLAPHFGAIANGPFNQETQMIPVIGLESPVAHQGDQAPTPFASDLDTDSFTSKQPQRLVKAVGKKLSLAESELSNIINWDLELYDSQPAQLGGLAEEFIYGGRIDDKLCSWSALEALVASSEEETETSPTTIKCVALFDDEEIGSLLRQGARGNFLPATVERIVQSFSPSSSSLPVGQTYANSFLISADVTHGKNPVSLRVSPKSNVSHSCKSQLLECIPPSSCTSPQRGCFDQCRLQRPHDDRCSINGAVTANSREV